MSCWITNSLKAQASPQQFISNFCTPASVVYGAGWGTSSSSQWLRPDSEKSYDFKSERLLVRPDF